MKTTQYFQYTRKRPDRACMKDSWIEFVKNNPIKEVIQSDGRIKRWAKIEEAKKSLGGQVFNFDIISDSIGLG